MNKKEKVLFNKNAPNKHITHYADFFLWAKRLHQSRPTYENDRLLYHCPLCPPQRFKATLASKVRVHLQNSHDKKAVSYKGIIKIAPCYLQDCGNKSQIHYHCVCGMVIARLANFERHLQRSMHKPKNGNDSEFDAIPREDLCDPTSGDLVEADVSRVAMELEEVMQQQPSSSGGQSWSENVQQIVIDPETASGEGSSTANEQFSHPSQFREASAWLSRMSAVEPVEVNGVMLYSCPLCPMEDFGAATLSQVEEHLQHGHLRHSVVYKDMEIAPCNLPCFPNKLGSHYHIPHDSTIVQNTETGDSVAMDTALESGSQEVYTITEEVRDTWQTVPSPTEAPRPVKSEPQQLQSDPFSQDMLDSPNMAEAGTLQHAPMDDILPTDEDIEVTIDHITQYRDADSWIESMALHSPTTIEGIQRYMCPLCPLNRFGPTNLRKLRKHLRLIHDKRAVAYKGVKTAPCYLSCVGRERAHYHCTCDKIVITCPRFRKHLTNKLHIESLRDKKIDKRLQEKADVPEINFDHVYNTSIKQSGDQSDDSLDEDDEELHTKNLDVFSESVLTELDEDAHLSHYLEEKAWLHRLLRSEPIQVEDTLVYKCPLCTVKAYKPDCLGKLENHLKFLHSKRSAIVQGMKIAPCFLSCHQDSEHAGAHYHCRCGMIVVRKSNFERHLIRQAHFAAMKAKLDKNKEVQDQQTSEQVIPMDSDNDHMTIFPCGEPSDNESSYDLLEDHHQSSNSRQSKEGESPSKRKSKSCSDFKELSIKLPKDVQCQVIVLITPSDKTEDKLKVIAEGLKGGVKF